MKGKNIFIFIFMTLFLLFIGLYITQAFGYYEFTNYKKSTLTDAAIKKFEQDVKNGKEIKATNYIEKEKNYNNLFSNVSLSLSNSISSFFNMVMNNMFNELDKLVSS